MADAHPCQGRGAVSDHRAFGRTVAGLPRCAGTVAAPLRRRLATPRRQRGPARHTTPSPRASTCVSHTGLQILETALPICMYGVLKIDGLVWFTLRYSILQENLLCMK